MTHDQAWGEFLSFFVEIAPAQFLISGAVLIARGAMPNDDFHMIGRNIARPDVTAVLALPVEGANSLAVHVRSKILVISLHSI